MEAVTGKAKRIFEAWLRCPIASQRMALAEKSPPGPDTPWAHRRPGDPLAGCFPTNLPVDARACRRFFRLWPFIRIRRPKSTIGHRSDASQNPPWNGPAISLAKCISHDTTGRTPLSWVAGAARAKSCRVSVVSSSTAFRKGSTTETRQGTETRSR